VSQRREPTLTDVAQAAGVSPTTVSRVLNNRGYLSEATKLRVAQAIEELGYRPNQVARALHGKSTQTVGVIVPTVALPFFGELAAELEDALAERGYRILVCNSMGRAGPGAGVPRPPGLSPGGRHHLSGPQRGPGRLPAHPHALGHRGP